MNRSVVIRSVLLVALSLPGWIARAQQPVQVNTILRPPYTLQLSDYYASTQEKLVVVLTNRDLNKPVLNVRLRMSIESQSVQLRSRDFSSLPILQLEAGIPLRLSLSDLAPYFNTENLEFAGITRAQYAQQAKLPEGFYQFCFEAIEISTGQVASAKTCAMAWMSLSDPPFLNLPRKGEAIALKEPQNIIFQWTPRHLNSPNAAYLTEYDFQLVEFWDNTLAPEVALQSMQPLYEGTTRTTTLLYGPTQPLLIAGKRYGWRVRARARSGVEEVDVFQNQGFSEIFWFTYQDVCPAPTGITATPGLFGNLEFSWMPAGKHKDYIVTYRQKDIDGATWFDQHASTPLALVYDVVPGRTYEYRVGAFCETDQPVYSELQTVRVPPRENTSFANCSIVPDPNITNKQALQTLKTGDVITAGNFPVKLSHVTGSGTFSGKGYVIVPFLGRAKVKVKFDNIQVNTQNQLIAGTVITTYDEDEGSVIDIDEGLDIFKDYQGIVSRLQDFTADSDKEDLKKVLDKITEKAEQELPAGEVEKVKENVRDLLEAKEAYDQIKTVYDELPDGDPLKTTLKKDLDEAYKAFEDIKKRFEGKDKNAITTDLYTIRFDSGLPPESTTYGFDAYKTPKFESNYDIVKHEDDKYFIPWKSVPAGEFDWVNAYSTTLGDVLPDGVFFRSSTGTLFSKSTLYGKGLTVKVHGYGAGEKNEVIAYQKKEVDGKEVTTELGKLNIASYEKLYKKLVIVPVNNTPLPVSQEEVRERLNKIYSQAVVEWSVEIKASLFSDYDVTNDGLDDDKEIIKNSSYTSEMKTIINDYKNKEALADDAHYLFIVPRSKSANQGYNPYKKQIGFIFMEPLQASKDGFVTTAAHELGHGAFNLKHTFDNTSIPKYATDNLMDYNGASKLDKYQWDLIHDPAFRIPFFESDEDAAYRPWVALEGDVISTMPGYADRIKSFLSPAGEIVTLPGNARDFTFTNGYLIAFTIADERYLGLAAGNTFVGYYWNAQQNEKKEFTVTNAKPYTAPSVVTDDPYIFYALKSNSTCGEFEIHQASYLPPIGTTTDGGINKPTIYRTTKITEASSILAEHTSLAKVQEGINCLSGRAKELFKFIEDHYASHKVIIPDKDKKELIALLALFNKVLISGLDVDPDKQYDEANVPIKLREMLNYGYIEFIANLKDAAAPAFLQKTDLLVAFEDFHRIKDLYLIYKIVEKVDPHCVLGERVYNEINKQLKEKGEVSFNLDFFAAVGKTAYEVVSLNESAELLVCLFKNLKIPESVYNPNRLDNKLQEFYKALFEKMLNINPDSPLADIVLTAESYRVACMCGVWNSVVDIFKGISETGAGATQSPDELLEKTREFAKTVTTTKGWSGLLQGSWTMLKEHHGYVNGYGFDSYQATYGACYDVVFVGSIFIGVTELKLLYEAGRAGEVGEMGLIVLRAARNYPRNAVVSFRDILSATAKLSNVAVRKIIFEIVEKIPDQIRISSLDGVNNIMIVNPMTGDIAMFTNEGIEVIGKAGSSTAGNVIYQSADDINDVNARISGKLTLVGDENGLVIAARVGGVAPDKKPTIRFPDGYDVNNPGLVAEFFDADKPDELIGRLHKKLHEKGGLYYWFEYMKQGKVIQVVGDQAMYLTERVLKADLDLRNLSGMGIGKTIFDDAMKYYGDQVDAVAGHWLEGDIYPGKISTNLDLYRKAILAGKSPEEAALATVTGGWASNHRFTAVEFVGDNPDKTANAPEITVLFKKEKRAATGLVKGYNARNAGPIAEFFEAGKPVGVLSKEIKPDGSVLYSFKFSDPTLPVFTEAISLQNGFLNFNLQLTKTKIDDLTKILLTDVMDYFGKEKILGISDVWDESGLAENLTLFKNASEGRTVWEAARLTITGLLAEKIGLTRIVFDNNQNLTVSARRIYVTFQKQGTFVKDCFDGDNNLIGKLYREDVTENRLVYYFESADGKEKVNRQIFTMKDGELEATLKLPASLKGKKISSAMFENAITTFTEQGKTIKSCRGTWADIEGMSDEYAGFMASLETLEDAEDAARSTATGRILTKLQNFTRVEVRHETTIKLVTAVFSREGEGFVKKIYALNKNNKSVGLGRLYQEVVPGSDHTIKYTFKFADPNRPDITENVSLVKGVLSTDFAFLKTGLIDKAEADDLIKTMREDAIGYFKRVVEGKWIHMSPDYTPSTSGPIAEFFDGANSFGVLSKENEGNRLYYSFKYSKPGAADILDQNVSFSNEGIISAGLNFEAVSGRGIGSLIRNDVNKIFGDRIKGINATWVEDESRLLYKKGISDNLIQFRKVLAETGDPKAAALSTFTGQWASQLDFFDITFEGEVSLTAKEIKVRFRKKG
jgi:TANFOR domain-containing protein